MTHIKMTPEQSKAAAIRVARVIYESQFEERFDDLNPKGIERALYEQMARAAIIETLQCMLEVFPEKSP